ncbi:ABC transporter permease [Alteriqipengyuania lutimaris]|uniref:Iron ABC transporter permease n=1 Tax=Alteriqipengyuania lutimaris TaxID=1538146 RepID=A0A395LKQ5_9SPHN|nr:iron ABC transporter permease [Alteriqipengyuania lutimaris]MBB3033719.1 iron(III) transport system permease protein [Alteriqipengyuania lutimaris]RDS77295.1 iron ABC transporter permease [Alteriqipengyuania lutimaris]
MIARPSPARIRTLPGLRLRGEPAWLGIAFALVLAAPLVALIALAAGGDLTYVSHLTATRLAEFTTTSLALVLMAGGLAACIGIGAAFIVSRYDFPGRRILDGALLLPLAMPGYIAAYAWYDMTAPGGPVYDATGGSIPTVAGLGGGALVFALTLYPYVYLLVRNVLAMNGPKQREVARSLGASGWDLFRRIDLPTIWPAAAAGVALISMEVLADFGVADFLGIPTFTVGIVRAWSSFGDPAAAAQLAVLLLFASMLALGAERASRGRRRFGSAAPGFERERLGPGLREAAMLVCALPLLLGLIVPLLHLVTLAIDARSSRAVLPAIQGTLLLATISAALAVIIGLACAYAVRSGGNFARFAVRAVQAGYAVPGAVAAIAVLAFLVIVQAGAESLRVGGAIALTGGSIAALLFAYQVRFAAIAILPAETALARVSTSLDEAARSLGARHVTILRRIHLPLISAGLGAAAVLVGIEVIKELPATMILRPFSLDTLAVTAHNFASDERLEFAAFPSLLLLAISIPATAMLNLLRTNP